MRFVTGLVLVLGLTVASMGAGKPLANVPKFDGKFGWTKLTALPPEALKSLAKAKSILIDITFSHDVKLKKDKGGNTWFTFILADQGSDWKWNQTTGSGSIPAASGTIKAGTYTISVPSAGIPATVLGGKQQLISLGPAASGLVSPISFTVDRVRGK